MDKQLGYTKRLFFLRGNKPDSLLARWLRSTDLSVRPINLKIGEGLYTTNPSKVVNIFSVRLKSLYAAPSGFHADRADALFSSINLLTMPPELRERLEAPITLEEVAHAIKLP